MSKKHTASSLIEEARDWANEVLDDYAYKNRYIGRRGRNNAILNNLLVNHFSFMLQIILTLANVIFLVAISSSYPIYSMILLMFLFFVQVPLTCWTASKLFNGR